MAFTLSSLGPLPPADEQALIAQHRAEVGRMLPLLGPLFGLAVLMFSLWDAWIDPLNASRTFIVRFALVALGALAYLPSRLPWSSSQRWAFVYLTHAGAITVCAYLLKDGFVYGLGAVMVCVFVVPVLTLRLRVMLLMLAGPALLFLLLSAQRLAPLAWINGVMLYMFAVILAAVILLVVRAFRQRAYVLEQQLLHIARHDSLTGAYNRGYLTELGEHELAVARRHGRALALAMLDIDFFKQVNDTYGHEVGDQVIQQLTRTCLANLRAVDHFGRIGGEEFVCILPEADGGAALACAERLRGAVEQLRLPTSQGALSFTISVGVALLQPHHADWASLLKDADTAMYGAKRGGRNRVVLADPAPCQT